jgi:hypothetical protein
MRLDDFDLVVADSLMISICPKVSVLCPIQYGIKKYFPNHRLTWKLGQDHFLKMLPRYGHSIRHFVHKGIRKKSFFLNEYSVNTSH